MNKIYIPITNLNDLNNILVSIPDKIRGNNVIRKILEIEIPDEALNTFPKIDVNYYKGGLSYRNYITDYLEIEEIYNDLELVKVNTIYNIID